MTTIGHATRPAGARRRQIRLIPALFAGAAAVATLTLFNPAPPGDTGTVVAAGSQVLQAPPSGSAGSTITVDDGGVNDNGQTSGDIFTQNAQDQSTASGAGT
jgi:hypothetical protein